MKFTFRMPKKLVMAGISLLTIASLTATAVAAFGPDRPTRAWFNGVTGFDHVTFNSFTGVPSGIGDEREFFRGVQVGRDGNWIDPVTNVSDDAVIEAKIYIHNNASAHLNSAPGNPGIARDVNVKVELPGGIRNAHDVKASISASNAQPKTVFDTLTISGPSGKNFELEYVAGSAKMYDHKTGSTTAVSDSIVTTGAKLPDMKGCFEYVREITFRMKVAVPKFEVKKTVRLESQDTKSYAEEQTAKNGDVLVWKVEVANTGTSVLRSVKFTDPIPAGTTFVPGSIMVYNSANPTGYNVPDSALQLNGTQLEIALGDYAPKGNAFIYFKTKVEVEDSKKCEGMQIRNIAFARPKDQETKGDDAKVNVPAEDCEEPEEPEEPEQPEEPCPYDKTLPKDSDKCLPPVIPDTGAGNIVGLLSAIAIAGGIAHRVYTVRFGRN